MQLSSLREEGAFSWLRVVEASGGEGRDWVQQCRAEESRALRQWADQALLHLRERRLEVGLELILEFQRRCRTAPAAPALDGLYRRIGHGVMAYYHYCRNEQDAALEALDQAEESLVDSLRKLPCLVFLAMDCCEFALHRARLARHRGDWETMAGQVDRARRMHQGDEPLCTPPGADPVTFSAILERYRATTLSPTDRRALEERLQPAQRLQHFHRFVAALYLLPGFVTPWQEPPGGWLRVR